MRGAVRSQKRPLQAPSPATVNPTNGWRVGSVVVAYLLPSASERVAVHEDQTRAISRRRGKSPLEVGRLETHIAVNSAIPLLGQNQPLNECCRPGPALALTPEREAQILL